MKRIIYMYLAAVTFLTVACTQEDFVKNTNEIIEEEQANDLWRITLGSSNPTLKARSSKTDGIVTNAENLEVGLCALSRGEGDWTLSTDSAGYPCLFKDKIATIKNGMMNFNDGVLYYPMHNKYCYDFYGYYPTDSVTTTSYLDKTEISFRGLNGQKDLIFGQTDVPEDLEYIKEYAPTAYPINVSGWNSRYMRALKLWNQRHQDEIANHELKAKDEFATINLKHVLTQVQFKAQVAYDQSESDKEAAKRLRIIRIRMINVNTGATVTIKQNKNYKSGFEWNFTNLGSFEVYCVVDGLVPPVKPGNPSQTTSFDDTNAVLVGNPFMVQPGEQPTNNGKYVAMVTIERDDETGKHIPQDLPLIFGGNFEPGEMNTVLINVYAQQEIKASVKVDKWVEGTNEESEIGKP